MMEDWIFPLTAASAAAAALAALSSFFQVRAAARAVEVDTFLRLADDYRSEQMRSALSALASFRRTRSQEFPDVVDAYDAEVANEPSNAQILRGHARIVTAYFGGAARLYAERFISKRLLKLLISRPGLNVYYDVCEPINIRRNPGGHSKQYGAVLRRVVRQYGDGTY